MAGIGQGGPSQAASIRADSVSITSLLQAYEGIRVPVYQRDYAWTSEETSELWADIQPLISQDQQTYFIGSMVFVGEQSNHVDVVDGQQRLIWATLLFCVLRDGCHERGETERATLIDNALIVRTDFATLEKQTRLMLNEHNNGIFQQIAKRELTFTQISAKVRERGMSPSNKLLCQTYVHLYNLASEATTQFTNTEQIGKIQVAVASRLTLIKIESSNDVSAYILFETLNDRGLDLTLADLLKNYLFSRSSARIEEIRAAWTEIGTLVGKSNLTRFLRHEWMSRKGKIRERELYGYLKESISNTQQVVAYTNGLKAAAEIYSAIENSEDPMWNSFGEVIKLRLKQIKLLGITQCYPLLLACKECLGVPEFRRVAGWIVSLTVRYSIIGEKGTGNLETLYGKASTLVRQQPLRMSDVRNAFLELWPEDSEFQTAFIAKSMSNESLIKYIIQSLERQATGSAELVADIPALTVEHILPRSPSDEWPQRLRQDPLHRDNVKRLGNLALLTATENSLSGNSGFAVKKPILAASQLRTTNMAGEFDRWDENSIHERQKRLAEWAVEIWRLEPNP